ncbi:MAG: MFS transporter [Candidatus Aramenus sp.]|jgi:MFS family permease|nr:MFS transporter [Candidatus Aramenus sp.]
MDRVVPALLLMVVFLISAIAIYSITFKLTEVSILTSSTLSEVELIISSSWIGGAIGGLVIGLASDRIGKKKALGISITLFSVPLLVNVLVDRVLAIYYVLWFLIGFGVNGDNGVSYVLIAEFSPPSLRATFGSLMQGFYFLGAMIGASLSAFLGFREFLLTISLLSLLSFLPWAKVPESKFRGGKFRPVEVFSRKHKGITVFGSMAVVGAFLFLVPLVSLGYTLFSESGFPRALSSFAVTVSFLVGFAGFTLAGRIADAIGKRRTTFAFLTVGLVGVALLVGVSLLKDFYFLLFVYPLLMFSSSFFAYFGVWISELYPPQLKGTGTNTAFFLGRLLGGGFGVFLVALLPLPLALSLSVVSLVSLLLVLAGVQKLRG